MKTVEFNKTGYGQWSAVTTYYGKIISMHFTDAPTYDLITSRERGCELPTLASEGCVLRSIL